MNKTVIDYAWKFVGLPYKFGGSNPMTGFDCSGLCVEILQAAGALKRKTDYSAQSLYDFFCKNGVINRREAGALSFYGKSVHDISHVGFHVDRYYMIEAGGGDKTTTTLDAAIKANACVRISPYDFRKDYLITVCPIYPVIAE